MCPASVALTLAALRSQASLAGRASKEALWEEHAVVCNAMDACSIRNLHPVLARAMLTWACAHCFVSDLEAAAIAAAPPRLTVGAPSPHPVHTGTRLVAAACLFVFARKRNVFFHRWHKPHAGHALCAINAYDGITDRLAKR